MSKLLKLKKWLTLPETAKHLSTALSEPVSVADVLQLGMEKHLRLTVQFVNGCRLRKFIEVDLEKLKYQELPSIALDAPPIVLPVGGQVWVDEHGQARQLLPQIIKPSDDLFDLPMIGAERLDVEHAYQQEIGGPEVTSVVLDGVLLQSLDGQYFSLMERFPKRSKDKETGEPLPLDHPNNFFPAGGLPNDSNIVVRPQSITDFLHSLTGQDFTEKLGSRERTTLLNIIGALLEEGGIKESAVIDSIQERHPHAPGLKKRTLEEKFAEAKRSLRASG